MKEKLPLWVRIVFGFCLAILLVSFVNVGISLFYENPEYEDFCGKTPTSFFGNQTDCELEGGIWQPYMEPRPVESSSGYCDFYVKCQEEYDKANEPYQRNAFVILAIIGFGSIVGGLFVQILTLRVMLLASGTINVLIGVIRDLEDRTLVFITLGILIALGIYLVIRHARK